MAVELGAGYLSVTAAIDRQKLRSETRDLENQLGRAGDDAGRRSGDGFAAGFGGGVKKAVGLAVAAFAGLQVGQFLKGAVDAASDLGETTSKVTQIFGQDALPALQEFAQGAARSLGQSEQSALDAAATFGVFGKSAGLTGKDLAGFSSEMVTLASDLASFGNTSPEEAIEAIGAALRGESEPIRKYGVLLDDATLKNRALALGLISTTKDALTPQQRVLAAQAEILAQTSDAQGDFARTSDGLANQQRILAAELANSKAQLGEALLPAATAVVTFLNNTGIPAFRDFTGAVKDAFGQIADSVTGVAGFGETVAVEIGKAFGWAEDDSRTQKMGDVFRLVQDTGAAAFFALRDAIRAATDLVVDVFTFVAENQDAFLVAGAGVATAAGSFLLLSEALVAVNAATAAFSSLQAAGGISGIFSALASRAPLLANPVGLVAVAIAAVGVAAFVAYKKFEPFRNVVDTVARTVRDVAVGAFERLRDVVAVVAPAIAGGLQAAFDGVRAAVDTTVAVFQTVAQTVITALTPLVVWINDNLISTINAILETVAATFQAVIETAAPFVQTWIAILSPIVDFTGGVFQAVYDIVSTVLGLVFDVAATQLGNILAGFQRFFETVAPLVQATWDTIITIVRTVFGVAKDIVESVLGSIRGVFQTFTGILSGDWRKIWEGINTILDSTLGNAVQIVARILGAVRDTVANLLGGLAGVAREAIGDLAGALYQAGRDLIGGLVDGIRDSIPSVRSVLGTVTNLIPDWKGPADVDKALLRPSGRYILEGLIAGFRDTLPKVEAQLSAVTNVVVDRVAVPRVQAAPVAAPAQPATPAAAPLSDGRWAVYLDGQELSRSFVRRERAGR